jgi:hypothetical protein
MKLRKKKMPIEETLPSVQSVVENVILMRRGIESYRIGGSQMIRKILIWLFLIYFFCPLLYVYFSEWIKPNLKRRIK